MSAELSTMFNVREFRERHRQERAEEIAKLCDWLRQTRDPQAYINDEIWLERNEVTDFLNTAESMEFAQIGELFVSKLLRKYSEQARAYIDERDLRERDAVLKDIATGASEF